MKQSVLYIGSKTRDMEVNEGEVSEGVGVVKFSDTNTLRCYRCQAYGHVAAVCTKEVLRCEKCAEGHETKE